MLWLLSRKGQEDLSLYMKWYTESQNEILLRPLLFYHQNILSLAERTRTYVQLLTGWSSPRKWILHNDCRIINIYTCVYASYIAHRLVTVLYYHRIWHILTSLDHGEWECPSFKGVSWRWTWPFRLKSPITCIILYTCIYYIHHVRDSGHGTTECDAGSHSPSEWVWSLSWSAYLRIHVVPYIPNEALLLSSLTVYVRVIFLCRLSYLRW